VYLGDSAVFASERFTHSLPQTPCLFYLLEKIFPAGHELCTFFCRRLLSRPLHPLKPPSKDRTSSVSFATAKKFTEKFFPGPPGSPTSSPYVPLALSVSAGVLLSLPLLPRLRIFPPKPDGPTSPPIFQLAGSRGYDRIYPELSLALILIPLNWGPCFVSQQVPPPPGFHSLPPFPPRVISNRFSRSGFPFFSYFPLCHALFRNPVWRSSKIVSPIFFVMFSQPRVFFLV